MKALIIKKLPLLYEMSHTWYNVCVIDTTFAPERNKKTKYLISFSLFRLLLKKSFHEISITEICDVAGVSRTTFYRHFQDKLDIIIEFTDERFEEFYDRVAHNYKTMNARSMILEILKIVFNYRLQILKLIEADLQNLLLNQLVYYFRYLFRQSHFKNDNIDLDNINSPHFVYGAAFCAGAIYSCILRWAEHNMDETPENLTNHILELLDLLSDFNSGKEVLVADFTNRR